jgi:hypothetical protein
MFSRSGATKTPRLYGLLFAGGYLALLAALAFLVDGARRAYQLQTEATKWPAVEARVMDCSIGQIYRYRGRTWGTDNQVQCAFHYEVAGREYAEKKTVGSPVFQSSKQIVLWKPKVTLGILQDWVNRHPRGSLQTVHYNRVDLQQISLAGADEDLQISTAGGQLAIGRTLFFTGISLLFAAMLARKRVRDTAE